MMTSVSYVEDTTLADTDMAEEINDSNALINTKVVSIHMDNSYNIDVRVNTESINISMQNMNSKNQPSNISLDSEYIDDDMSSTAVVGFCVTGLNSQKSPTRFNFYEDNNMNISIDSNTSNEKEINNGLNAQEIVDKCSK